MDKTCWFIYISWGKFFTGSVRQIYLFIINMLLWSSTLLTYLITLHNILSNNVAIIGLPTFVLINGMICSVLTWSYNIDVPAGRSTLKFNTTICWRVENNLITLGVVTMFWTERKSFHTGIKSVFQNVFFFIYIFFFHDFVNVGFINYSQIEKLSGVNNSGCGSGIVILFKFFCI